MSKNGPITVYLCTVALMLIAPIANIASAGEYEMVKGGGVEVCDAYARYLSTEKQELTCDRDISGLANFDTPVWQPLDLQQNKLLVVRIENYLQTPRDPRAAAPWRPRYSDDSLDTFSPNSLARLAVADIDINNDGKPEPIAKYRSFRCDSWGLAASPRGPQWVAPIVVLDKKKKDVDREKTYPLMQNPEKMYAANAAQIDAAENKLLLDIKAGRIPPAVIPEMRKAIPRAKYAYSRYAPGIADLAGYDVFLFNNQAYFDKWDEQEGHKNVHLLSVYKTEDDNTQELCRYRWHDR